jgi:hypothetical protein
MGATATGAAFLNSSHLSESSDSEETTIRKEYEDIDLVRNEVNKQQKLLQKLEQEGVLSKPAVEIAALKSSCEYHDSTTGATVRGVTDPRDAKPTAIILVRKSIQEGLLTISLDVSRENQRPRAIIKPRVVPEGGEPVEAQVVTEQEVRTVQIVPESPQEARNQIQSAEISQTSGPEPSGIVTYGCANEGEVEDCGYYKCDQWEVECTGDNDCRLLDCNGNTCCGGCCCCEDIDWCCEICGDYDCENDPCFGTNFDCASPNDCGSSC